MKDGEAMVNFMEEGRLRIEALLRLAERPPLFEPGESLFWNDPHISKQMLEAHLDPNTEAASRTPPVIEQIVDWLSAKMDLRPGDRLLDLGCGPGLYCVRFAERGLRVTGVDYSSRSLAYAREQAEMRGLPIEYVYQDYTSMDASRYSEQFKGVTLIYGDICVLRDDVRDRVLANVYAILQPGGMFAFDVTTPLHEDRYGAPTEWRARMSGFWKPGPHLVLAQLFDYEDAETYLRRSIVIEEDGKVSDYRIWTHLYSAESMEPVLRRAGFDLVGVWSDLAGAPYDAASQWLGFVARKPGRAV